MSAPISLLFHTCGSHAIGMGNVMRALALAQAFQDAGTPVTIRFAVPERGEGSDQIESRGYPADLWDSSRLAQPDVVIVDVPHSDAALFKAWSARGALTVCIDDPGPGRYAADLVFTMLYAPAAVRPAGCVTEEVGEFGQFDYFPLRKGFDGLSQKPIRDQARRLLVVQGGSDAYGTTPRVCRALARIERDLEVDVVMGPAFRQEALLRQLTQQDARFRLHRQPQMLGLMQDVDMAVSAAGVTALELAAAGVPMLLLVGQPREAQTAAALERQGAAVYLGQSLEVSDAGLSAAILSLLDDPARRRALSLRSQSMVDGRGAQRIADAILARVSRAQDRLPEGDESGIEKRDVLRS